MSLAVTGPYKGRMMFLVPQNADQQMIQYILDDILQLDHVDTVDIQHRHIVPQHSLSGNALIDLHDEITQVIDTAITTYAEKQKQAARHLLFSSR